MLHDAVDLKLNVPKRVSLADGPHELELLAVEHETEPDFWCAENESRQTIRSARVVLKADGREVELIHRPYEMPTLIGRLKLYVETTRRWAEDCAIAKLDDLRGEVRLTVTAADEPWSPPGMVFPIADYRWRSSSYNNTWGSLVPFNKLYYHRGEDYGAIPDRLDVVSPVWAKLTALPGPEGDGASNSIVLEYGENRTLRMAHINSRSINRSLRVGQAVAPGQQLAQTGCTWAGRRCQHHDPHLHVGINFGSTRRATYPHLVDAYLNTYGDPALAVAGGYHFTVPGRAVTLDATRCIPRAGEAIQSYRWEFGDGSGSDQPVVQRVYDAPGHYSEQLTIRTAGGYEARDFAQVRVYDPSAPATAYGWAYHTPVRGIRPGTPVTFWNRIANFRGRVWIDYGDGKSERIVDLTQHSFRRRGVHTVTLTATGPNEEPITVRMPVVVEK
ncbi:MAG: PKD domain-containing protein [Phycisphaerae bacterium]